MSTVYDSLEHDVSRVKSVDGASAFAEAFRKHFVEAQKVRLVTQDVFAELLCSLPDFEGRDNFLSVAADVLSNCNANFEDLQTASVALKVLSKAVQRDSVVVSRVEQLFESVSRMESAIDSLGGVSRLSEPSGDSFTLSECELLLSKVQSLLESAESVSNSLYAAKERKEKLLAEGRKGIDIDEARLVELYEKNGCRLAKSFESEFGCTLQTLRVRLQKLGKYRGREGAL